MAGGKGKTHGGKAGGKSGSGPEGKTQQSHSAKAGLQFPCGRVKRFLKNNTQHKMRVGAKGAGPSTSVVLEVAGQLLTFAS